MRQSAALTDKKAQGQQQAGLLGHAAIRPHPSHTVAAGVDSDLRTLTHDYGHNFTNVSTRTPAPGIPANYATPACPAFPQRCPFGGACHACPVTVQAKLAIDQPGDSYEQEADRVAERVMRMPESSIPTTTASSTRSTPSAVPPIVHEVLRSPGQPLDPDTRAFFEPRFGHDFSQVRVHTDAKAAESARTVNALAYTVGRDIVFGSSHIVSDTRQGRELIAHELAHVVQQSQNAAFGTPQSFGGDEHGPAETEANHSADQIVRGAPGGIMSAQPSPSLHRKVNVDKPKDLIDNPTGKGLVQTNAQVVEGYLQTLCSGGTVSVDKGSGVVSLAVGFCPTPMPADFVGPPAPAPADKSKEPTGCNCLCDMVGSANDYKIIVDDKDWPHTSGRVVTAPSPNSPKLWGAATASGKATTIDPWLVLGHEFCGHAWLAEKGLPDNNATRGKGGHQETVGRENELRKEHGIEARGSFKDPFCGESFWRDKAGPGPVQWSSYLKICEAWRKKTYGGRYKISDKIP